MTIKELVNWLTHVALINISDFSQYDVVLGENTEIDEVRFFCKNKDGITYTSVAKFNEILKNMIVDRENNKVRLLLDLTKIETIRDTREN